MSDSEIHRSLGRIEGELKQLKEIKEGMDDINGRVANLERKGAAAGAVAGVFSSVFVSVLAYNLRGIGGPS